jgi:hypothetical protein
MWWALVLEARSLMPFTSLELRMDDEPTKVDLAKPLEGDNIRWKPNAMHEQVGAGGRWGRPGASWAGQGAEVAAAGGLCARIHAAWRELTAVQPPRSPRSCAPHARPLIGGVKGSYGAKAGSGRLQLQHLQWPPLGAAASALPAARRS